MTRTTEQWEALLDGTTPGPWEWHDDQDDPDMRFIYGDEGGMCMTVEPVGSDYRDADPVLAAHAPAAVAEVIRLRRALEDLRDDLSKARANITRGAYEYGRRTAFRSASSRLTRILEGDNHE